MNQVQTQRTGLSFREVKRLPHEALKFAIVNMLGLPSGVSVVMKAVGKFDKVSEYLDCLYIQNLLWRPDSLFADIEELAKQCARSKIFWGCYAKECFQNGADRSRHF